jgi:signal transduction histidine kinase
VALTGHGDEHVAVLLMKAGAVDYIPKSAATPERLASTLRYAIELSRAHAQARAAEDELRASAQRARFLAEASAVLARSLDVRSTLERVAQLSVPILGDYCLIYLAGDRGPIGIASAHRDPAKQRLARILEQRLNVPPDHPSSGVAEVMRTGRVKLLTEIPAEHIDALVESPEERAAIRALAPQTALFVPLVARSTLGAIAFCREQGRPEFSIEDIALAEDLASRAATAIENARLFDEVDRARDRTERLQEVTAKLSTVTSRHDVAVLFVAQARETLGASTAWLGLRTDDGQEVHCAAHSGFSSDAIDVFDRVSIASRIPIADTLRDGMPRWFASKAAMFAEYPNLPASVRTLDRETIGVLPLTVGTEIIGVLTIGFKERRELSEDEMKLTTALVQQCAQALERARLYDAERTARGEAEVARRDAEEANRAKSQFLARMSHDLRTPLNAIAGYAQLIEEGIYGTPTPGQRESLARIRRAQAHLLTLINDVLSFAKLEAGQVSLTVEAVPVRPALDSLITLIEPQAKTKGLSVQLETVRDDLTAVADRERMTQILLNIVTNAVKFTETGGGITLSAEPTGDAIAIRVRDTGVGIPAERLGTIFDPFVQGGRGADEARQGVGLGLAISRELARMMGGNLRVESTVGQGSTFTLELPGASTQRTAETASVVETAV